MTARGRDRNNAPGWAAVAGARLHQNWGGKKTVQELTFNLNDLEAGWVKVYRPQE